MTASLNLCCRDTGAELNADLLAKTLLLAWLSDMSNDRVGRTHLDDL